MKVAIIGSREYTDLAAVIRYVEGLPKDTIVVSGGARGVDRAAEQTARRCGLRVHIFLADWNRYGKQAGMLRNAEVAAAANRVVAFWDGRSPGTSNTIERARAAGKPVEICSDRPAGLLRT